MMVVDDYNTVYQCGFFVTYLLLVTSSIKNPKAVVKKISNNVKGSPCTAVKLLSCDHEVMGSSPENNLLQKCRERMRT
jgi:hypothetical protein